MSRFRWPSGLTIWPMLLAVLWAAGCSRPDGLGSSEGTAQANQHPAPFHDGEASASTTAHPVDAADDHSSKRPENGLPFRDAQNLPAGTLLTVRLKNPVSANNPTGNITFEAVVDEPVVIDGNTLIARGAAAAGRVESSLASSVRRNRGYIRLVLDSIQIAGSDVPVQTASLFAREAPQAQPSAIVSLEKGRRLTFRLTDTLYLASQRASAGH